MEPWILFTLLAALMQSVRTAGQKRLAAHISPMTTTLVRYLFGLPFALVYLALVTEHNPLMVLDRATDGDAFLWFATLASIAQILATAWLIQVLRLRNFAVGTVLSKTEAIQTAVFGLLFFGAALTPLGWLAVLLGTAGVICISLPGKGQNLDLTSVSYGLLSGLGFACTALWLRQASLSLGLPFIESAALTLAFTVCLQTAICLTYVAVLEKQQLLILLQHLRLAVFVGATSALVSVGWYTAMTYENAALVRSLGQIELLFAAAITYGYFREKISAREMIGMTAIAVSVLLILQL